MYPLIPVSKQMVCFALKNVKVSYESTFDLKTHIVSVAIYSTEGLFNLTFQPELYGTALLLYDDTSIKVCMNVFRVV